MKISPINIAADLDDVCAQLVASRWGEDNDMAMYSPKALRKFLSNDQNVLVVGRANDQIICAALCYILDHPDASRKSLYVDELDTHPDHRRKGYASEMIAWLRSYASERNLREVWLGTEAEDNQVANAFYKSLHPTEITNCNLYSYSSKAKD